MSAADEIYEVPTAADLEGLPPALAGGEPGEVLLRADRVTKVFGHGHAAVRAVEDVSFDLRTREVVAIVGESGSGKSTLARLVLRLMPVTSGTISLAGEDVTAIRGSALRDHWRNVQAVFQDPFSSFNQFFTVRRLLMRSRRLRAVSDLDLEKALGHVGLKPDDVLEKYPHQLSGGQRQRVMIARALLLSPKLLIADEATSMLDASLRANILNVLSDLRSEVGLTVLFITHDIGQACYIADRVLVMSNGMMVEQGKTDEVIFNPTHPYTKRLLADVPKLHPGGSDAL
jgi:ABC-type oligopeptide transport system ATPase subunit